MSKKAVGVRLTEKQYVNLYKIMSAESKNISEVFLDSVDSTTIEDVLVLLDSKFDKPISFCVPGELYQKLLEVCAENGLKISDLLRAYLSVYCARKINSISDKEVKKVRVEAAKLVEDLGESL